MRSHLVLVEIVTVQFTLTQQNKILQKGDFHQHMQLVDYLLYKGNNNFTLMWYLVISLGNDRVLNRVVLFLF
jgi:hypothetical protein